MQPADEELSPEELTALLSSFMPEIPGYRVLRRIGKGGMSQVYLGVQESLDRQVAIKVMSPSALTDEISKQRFEHEARTIAKLEHPCIVGIHEVGRTQQGLLYYVLPYLAKGHLGQRDFTRDEMRAVEVLRALLSALEYAHARGIVHRDVKAENVLFDNADRPLLTDFGIALSKRDSTRITTAGLAVGSGGYMAPEQARGEVVDGRADLYSVGVLAYELLTGRLPYQAADPLALALMHAQDPIPRLPPERKHWQPFIDRAMAKSADNRYRNAQQMLGALNQIAQQGAQATTSGTPAAGWLAGHAKPVLAAVAGLLLLVAGVAWWQSRGDGDASPDFYTVEDAAPAPEPMPAQPAPDAPATTVPASAPAEPAEPLAPPATAAEPAANAFAGVVGTVTVTRLDYDPSRPGAREMAAARRQIDQNRLSLPPGDNAAESLQSARRVAPDDPVVASLSDELITAFGRRIVEAIAGNRDDQARTLHERAEAFAKANARLEGNAWLALRESLNAPLLVRLERSFRDGDGAGIASAKAVATTLAVPPSGLEPAWSRAVVLPKAGDLLKGPGPTLVLARVPAGNRAGLAVMRHEVSRSDYAAFASATGRPAAKCKNRTVPFNLKKRTWSDPGFSQSGNHPVVCISGLDAAAYAQWLGQRSGQRLRLPTRSEWQLLAGYRGNVAGPNSKVREWLADCVGAGCGKRLVAGTGWRDSASKAEPARTSEFDADTGFDDIGFRLVRDVGLAELGGR